MGTRGVFGFRSNKVDKLTYNHFDSYPSGLGKDMFDFIRNHTMDEIKTSSERIQLVDSDSTPTNEQIKECEFWTDLKVGEKSIEDWYCLLRNTQSTPEAYPQGLKYMIDSSSFLLDSLFCEYAYIINLDTNELEFYSGFNKVARNNKGRYSSKFLKNDDGTPVSYYGVVLIEKIPLSSILAATADEIKIIIEKMDKKSDSFYNRQQKKLEKEKASKKNSYSY